MLAEREAIKIKLEETTEAFLCSRCTFPDCVRDCPTFDIAEALAQELYNTIVGPELDKTRMYT